MYVAFESDPWPARWFFLLALYTATTPAATLVGYATLPADTFVAGPTSGQFIKATNIRQTPFENRQPVQGFSALINGENDSFLVLSDNGFGTRSNSPDYLLSIYRIYVDFRTEKGGTGSIRLGEIIHFSDPHQHLPCLAKHAPDRLLTGADLDPESFQKLADSSYWIGEEFIPALLHFSAEGVLLAPPFRLAGLSAVDNPCAEPATLPRSRGFEGMAQSPDGVRLFPMLEGALLQDAASGLGIYTFDTHRQQFLNAGARAPSYHYRLDEGATAIGDFTLYSATKGMIIERDSRQGEAAALKKVYRVDLTELDEAGFLIKTLLVDLLDIDDPYDLNLDGNQQFSFPYKTIEGLLVIDRSTLGIVNDNNYPFGGAGTTPGAQPDNNEFILLKVAPLWD